MLCPECKTIISNEVKICPNCGFRIQYKDNIIICKINGVNYDFTDFYNRIMNIKANGHIGDKKFIAVTQDMRKLTNVAKTFKLCQMILENEKVPEEYNDNYTMDVFNNEQRAIQASKPKCPMCGSTNISKISSLNRTVSIVGFGILSKKIGKQWQCNNPKCKHMW